MAKTNTNTENKVTIVGQVENYNAELQTAMVTQTAAPELGMAEKKLYYLVIRTSKGTYQLNVGEKTYTTIKNLI